MRNLEIPKLLTCISSTTDSPYANRNEHILTTLALLFVRTSSTLHSGSDLCLLQTNLYIPPSVNNTADPALVDPNCVSDYLELRDGDSAQGRIVWRKCRSDFNMEEVFEMTSNQLYLVLSTSGPSNASFIAEYGDSQKQLGLVFIPQDANSPPVMMGIPISTSWSTVYPLPSSGTSWVRTTMLLAGF